MPEIVGVSFREAGKVYPLDPGSLEVHQGDVVVAESARGVELGLVRTERRKVAVSELTQPLRVIIRLAGQEDLEQDRANRLREREAIGVCAAKVHKHGLPMKLIRAEYTLDRARIIFFFSAEGRVDFRELVKDLAGALRTRIELHQVGARDAARLMGGLGRCGRPLCCASWITSFEPVSMKMAKDQDLALNPAKFSGQCGKLMCCLRFEVDHYRAVRQVLPRVGTTIMTASGEAKVVEVNVPAEGVTVEYTESGARGTLTAEALDLAAPDGTDCPGHCKCRANPGASG